MNSVRKNKRKSGFKSYIVDSLEAYDERPVDVPEEIKEEALDPILLPDEVVVAEAKNVLKFTSLRTKKVVILGKLFVTNFKLSFVTSSLPVDPQEKDLHSSCLHSDFLGLHDVSLTQIDTIYCLEADGTKKKKLTSSTPLPNKVKGLQIVLKSFRVINFGFALTQSKEDLRVTNALLVHRFSKKLDLFYLALDMPPPKDGIPSFRLAKDWEKELERTRCQNWRVTKHNEENNVFESLSPLFVVPHSITDSELAKASHYFRGNRPPVWCWGTPRGAALVRMAQVSPNISSNTSVENELMKLIHKSHPSKVQPTILDLDNLLPSLKNVQSAYNKLKELHTPDSTSSFSESEKSYLSKWQTSGWLWHVQACLELASNASSAIALRNSSVILQEGEGRDLSCLISCLVQLLVDPFARTLRGFHTLIQKEWVALGHPFCTRLGHLCPGSEDGCPVWLLFLDCVNQISLRHPTSFEFTSDYLLALWHASHCSLFSTFMFDCTREALFTLRTLREEGRYKELFYWPLWSWWAQTEGVRTILQKGCLTKQKESLHRRRSDLQKRLSTASSESSPDTLKKESSAGGLGQEKRLLQSEEKQLKDEEKTFRREGQVRERARETFINVLYIQKLLESLVTPEALTRLCDPVTSVNATWQRLCYLLGKSSNPLPYDPTLPVPPSIEIPAPLSFGLGYRIRPWTECFGYWVPEGEVETHAQSTSWQPEESKDEGVKKRVSVIPSRNALDEHWRLTKEIYLILENYYSFSNVQNAVNGKSS
ncbi:UNVERIFIED_CONTAM: hypothetical protein RMT77_013605 [Armadillidium vulgare]